HRREVVVVERAALDVQVVGELDAPVGMLDLDGHARTVPQLEPEPEFVVRGADAPLPVRVPDRGPGNTGGGECPPGRTFAGEVDHAARQVPGNARAARAASDRRR